MFLRNFIKIRHSNIYKKKLWLTIFGFFLNYGKINIWETFLLIFFFSFTLSLFYQSNLKYKEKAGKLLSVVLWSTHVLEYFQNIVISLIFKDILIIILYFQPLCGSQTQRSHEPCILLTRILLKSVYVYVSSGLVIVLKTCCYLCHYYTDNIVVFFFLGKSIILLNCIKNLTEVEIEY